MIIFETVSCDWKSDVVTTRLRAQPSCKEIYMHVYVCRMIGLAWFTVYQLIESFNAEV